LIGELGAARSRLARDWQDVAHATRLPARLSSGLRDHKGTLATTAVTAIGLLAARALRPFRSRKHRLPALHPLLRLALLEGVDLLARKEWQRATARRLIALFDGSYP